MGETLFFSTKMSGPEPGKGQEVPKVDGPGDGVPFQPDKQVPSPPISRVGGSTLKAKGYAQRFKGRCDYVYRYERDETAKLLDEYAEFLVQSQKQLDELLRVRNDNTEMASKLEHFKEMVRAKEDSLKASLKEVERQKKVQKLYGKFGKRNFQALIQFIEREYGNLGFDVVINDDQFEEQFRNYVAALPDFDETFLL